MNNRLSEEISLLRRRLLRWYSLHQRTLPWRSHPTPYRVWVSEIMLQQTQVATVIEYFNRFLKQFPNVQSLANADEATVMRAWEGLGYYRRARQLHAAAKQIFRDHEGDFPQEFADILKLPGIGRYTAGAIASIAFQQQRPIVEGNTIRLYSRLLDWHDDIQSRKSQERFWELAESIVKGARKPGDVNQALMEVGNRVCRVANPDCNGCPLRQHCGAFQAETQALLPIKTAKVNYEAVREIAIVVRKQTSILLRECKKGERWAGLWDFPRYAHESANEISEMEQRIRSDFGVSSALSWTELKMKHAVTKFRIELSVMAGQYHRGRLKGNSGIWVPIAELHDYPLSVTGRKIADSLV
ncbi:MAG: A/G-specific adenine glycosylase [Pirellulaceae bacterium]